MKVSKKMGKLGFNIVEEKMGKMQQQQPKTKYEYFKVTTQPKRIRFLTLDGDSSILIYAEHFVEFNNGWRRSVSCPDFDLKAGETKSCPICKAKKGVDLVKNDYGTKIMMQIIDRSEGEDKIKIFKFSPFLWTTLLAFHKENGDLGDRDYNISMDKVVGENNRESTVYNVTPASKKAMPLTDEDEELAATRNSLTDIEPILSDKEILELMSKEASGPQANEENVKSTLNKFFEEKTPETVMDNLGSDSDEDDEEDTAAFFRSLKK
jgi:hypothetical protein